MVLIPCDAEVIDVTVPSSTAMPTWPAHPPSTVEPSRRPARDDASNVSLVSISSHASTHVDANRHDIDDETEFLDIPLSRWIGPCHVIRVPDEARAVEPDHLEVVRLHLSAVEPGPYQRLCLPLKLAIGDGAPARVLLGRER